MKHKLKRAANIIDTDLYFLLKNLPGEVLFHEEHELIHPLEMYDLLMGRVIAAFKRVLRDIYSQNDYSGQAVQLNNLMIQTKKGLNQKLPPDEVAALNARIVEYENRLKQIFELEDHESRRVLDSQKELISSLSGFVDDSLHIIQCFYPADAVNKDVDSVGKWIEYADKHLYKEYMEKIDSYMGYLMPLIHALKHDNADLSQVRLKTEHGFIDGYYVCGADPKGATGPDRKIHHFFRNRDTAFSYNRDLKYHLINLVLMTHYMKVSIDKILHKKGVHITLPDYTPGESEDLFHIAEQIEKLPTLFYPDEVFKQIPEVRVTEDAVKFIIPSNEIKPIAYMRSEVRTGIGGSNTTPPVRLPYVESKPTAPTKRPVLR